MKKIMKQSDISSFFNVSNAKKKDKESVMIKTPTPTKDKAGASKQLRQIVESVDVLAPTKSSPSKTKTEEAESSKRVLRRADSDKLSSSASKSSSKSSKGKELESSSKRSRQLFDSDEEDLIPPKTSLKKNEKKVEPSKGSRQLLDSDEEDLLPPKTSSKRNEKKVEPSKGSRQLFDSDEEDLLPPKTSSKRNEKKVEPSKRSRHRTESDEEDFPPPKSTAKKSRGKEMESSKLCHHHDSDGDDEDLPPKTTHSKSKKKDVKSSKRSLQGICDSDEEDFVPIKSSVKNSKGKESVTSRRSCQRIDSDEDDLPPPKSFVKITKRKEVKSSKRSESRQRIDSDEDDLPPPTASTQKKSKSKKADVTPVKKDDETKPILTPEEKKRVQSSNYFKYLSRGGPKNLGSKEVPVGAPNCLNALTFVTTGVLDSFERDDIVTIVGKYGGRVTTTVSRKTSYLLVGNEPGESKIKKAKDLKIPEMTEDEFLGLIRKSNPNQPLKSQSQFLGGSDDDNIEIIDVDVPDPIVKSEKSTPITTTPTKSKPGSKRSRAEIEEEEDLPPAKAVKSENHQPLKIDIKPLQPKSAVPVSDPPKVIEKKLELMWVDKYKPQLLKNVVGQLGEKSNANKLFSWLKNWFNYHGKSDEKVKAASFGLRDPEGKTFKAALLSGPPGIGKTTTAHLCCKEIGYDFFELNASDTRNKKGLHEMLSDSLTSEALTGFKDKSKRHILIMDEVDGMSGNEDRGGIQELIGLIRSSKVPIICVCNERNHPKIRSLANYCFDLRFNKPTNEQLKAMVSSICFKEKMKLPMESVLQLIQSTDHDIRQILHQIQLIKESSTSGASLYNPKKDLRFGPWDVCRKVFSATEHKTMSIYDKSNLFFQDYNIGPLFVQENYIKWTPLAAKGNRYKHMDLIKSAAESLATGDLIENLLRRSNNWSLLPTQAIFSSLLPGEYMEGDVVTGIEFPQWLGKNSHQGKMSRLLQQLHNHMHLQVSGSLQALNMEYLPYLRGSIVNPLVTGDTEDSVSRMQEYCLMREDLDNIIELSLYPGRPNPMDRVDTKTKSAFTRQVNKEILPYSIVKISKGRGAKKEEEDALEEIEEEEENPETEEEEEDLEKDGMIKRSKKSTKTSNSEPVAGTSKKGGSSKSSSTKSNSGGRSGKKK